MVNILNENKNKIRFLLDSGAFTAWKAGKPIALDDYCRFIESLPFKPWRYFTLDVIGDPEASFKNYETMLKRGFNPVPIFTRGEDLSMIDEYYKTSDVLGLGGLVGTKGNLGFVKGIMKHIGKRKVHWLGFVNQKFVNYYKPYMCDCSTWASSVIYARMNLYIKNGKWINATKKDFENSPSKEIRNVFKDYGIDINRLQKKEEWKNSGKGDCALEIVPCRSWVKYQLDLDRKMNVNFFLACASDMQVKLMLDSYNYWMSK